MQETITLTHEERLRKQWLEDKEIRDRIMTIRRYIEKSREKKNPKSRLYARFSSSDK